DRDTAGTTMPEGPSAPSPGIPFNVLWPIVDRPHLGVNGVFTDDDLLAQIKPGGRLATLVDTLASAGVSPGMVTLVIDPLLLDELDRMSRGYWVVAHPGKPQPPLTPTVNASTSTETAPTTATESSGTTTESSMEATTPAGTA